MNNAELIKALRCEGDCKGCSYWQDNSWSHCDEWGMRCDAADALEAAEKRIAELMPKEGEWIGVNPMVDTEQCSICGWNIPTDEFESNYCPNCGARMRGEQK